MRLVKGGPICKGHKRPDSYTNNFLAALQMLHVSEQEKIALNASITKSCDPVGRLIKFDALSQTPNLTMPNPDPPLSRSSESKGVEYAAPPCLNIRCSLRQINNQLRYVFDDG